MAPLTDARKHFLNTRPRCREMIAIPSLKGMVRQCSRAAVSGDRCGMHTPEAKQAREKAKEARWNAKHGMPNFASPPPAALPSEIAMTEREEAERVMDTVVTGNWAMVKLGRELRDAIESALTAAVARGRAEGIEDFWRRHAAWSNATFGDESERGPLGPLRHLEKEAGEAQDAPGDIIEYADCLMLILDATRRAGFTLADLLAAANRKLAINQAREWPKTAPDQAVEHVRSIPTQGETR